MMKLPMINGSVMRKLLGSALIGLMAAPFLAGCQEKDKPKPGSLIPNYARRDGFGCVQGVIMNGFTGQRFDLSTMKEPDGIYALIRGQKLRAQYFRDDANLMGEYYICDIPLETTVPIFANVTGYLPFEAQVKIESSRPIRVATSASASADPAPNAVTQEAPIPDPILLGNFRLYPKQNGTRSLVINVRDEQKAIADAMVDLQPITTAGQFAFDGTFLNTLGTRLVPTRKTTGADGVATFAASEIAYGTRYKLTVTPSAAQDLGPAASRTFVLGIGGALSPDRNNWEFNVDLSETNNALAVVACSASNQSYNADGTVTIVVNRPVQLAAGVSQKDNWVATLGGAGIQAVLTTSNTTNNASEHFDVNLSGDGKIITLALKAGAFSTNKLTPNYSLPTTDNANKDLNLTVTYPISSIKFDVIDSEATAALNSVALTTSCNSTRFFKEY